MNKTKIINESIDYIIQHLDENISVEDVAKYFHYSKYYFCRVFNPFFPQKLEKFKTFYDYDKSITIQYINDFFVIYERFIGNYV